MKMNWDHVVVFDYASLGQFLDSVRFSTLPLKGWGLRVISKGNTREPAYGAYDQRDLHSDTLC